MNPDIVLVGAGPVGLFTAIEMKLHNPALKIKILERNKEYKRHHILRLDEASLKNSKAYKNYEAVRALNGFVPTSDIETTFLNILKKLQTDVGGIEIERGVKVDSCQDMMKQYPSAHTVIGADGAHSIVRKQLFGDKKIVDTNLQYIVEIKYKAKGKAALLSNLTYGPALGQVNHFISENVGKEKGGFTPVSLFAFVDKETYDEIRQTPNAKLTDLHPISYRMKQLLNTIQPWLSLRKAALKEEMVEDSELINGVALDVYQSEQFALETNGKRAYLVGDAGAAVPYYRALNEGLIAATVTAQAVAGPTPPDLQALNKQLSDLAKNAIKRANKMNNKVLFGRRLRYLLANASKITTGALLNSDYEQAMLNARVTRPNIFRRNPRNLLATGLIVITTFILFPYLLSLAVPMGPAIVLALVGATALIATGAFLFKLTCFLIELFKEHNRPEEPLRPFPWETGDKLEDPLTVFSKTAPNAGGNPSLAVQSENIRHFASPLAAGVSKDRERERDCKFKQCELGNTVVPRLVRGIQYRAHLILTS